MFVTNFPMFVTKGLMMVAVLGVSNLIAGDAYQGRSMHGPRARTRDCGHPVNPVNAIIYGQSNPWSIDIGAGRFDQMDRSMGDFRKIFAGQCLLEPVRSPTGLLRKESGVVEPNSIVAPAAYGRVFEGGKVLEATELRTGTPRWVKYSLPKHELLSTA
jgi:hypothetical protein